MELDFNVISLSLNSAQKNKKSMAQAPELLRSSLGCLKGDGSRKILKLDFFPSPESIAPLH